jgi:hypothetical protein
MEQPLRVKWSSKWECIKIIRTCEYDVFVWVEFSMSKIMMHFVIWSLFRLHFYKLATH